MCCSRDSIESNPRRIDRKIRHSIYLYGDNSIRLEYRRLGEHAQDLVALHFVEASGTAFGSAVPVASDESQSNARMVVWHAPESHISAELEIG